MSRVFLVGLGLGCSPAPAPEAEPPERSHLPLGSIPAGQDIVSTDLVLDLATRSGTATLTVVPAPDTAAVAVDVHGLTVHGVTVAGEAVEARFEAGIATVAVPPRDGPVVVSFEYTFPARTLATFDGWMPEVGTSFVWPDACGNLFPCNPSPVDGSRFTLSVTGAPEGEIVVFAPDTVGDAPAYQVGFATGAYSTLDLGTTPAGTHLSAWYLPAHRGLARAEAGTAHFLAGWSFFEATYGPYAFGSEAGTVEVDWGVDSYGGMEHHPMVHVARFDQDDEEAQLHEIAHGWFGDAVRLACWEDFVLSEGTVTYMAARAAEEVGGPDLWSYYVDDFLTPICAGREPNGVVLPDTCNEIDFENSPVWSLATYMKGACFYEDVADRIGVERVDAAIAAVYADQRGSAARMQAMLDELAAQADPEDRDTIEALATEWLRTEACPTDWAARCGAHTP